MKITLTLPIAIFALTGTLAVAQSQSPSTTKTDSKSQASGTEKTLTGVVSDSMCGAKHMMKGATSAECTRTCVEQGSSYALVVGTKVYTLEGNSSGLDK